jgi:transcriptional regulator with XRE-family HTH domain
MERSLLRIEPFAVDASIGGSKNGSMTKEQLQQFAETLRTGRAKLDLNKSEFCQKAGITPNTLRALERGAQHPNPETIDRLARLLGTTATALTNGKRAIDMSDPLLANLNDEDLEVAQAFHHAPMRVKERALGVLQERARRSRGGKDSTSHDVVEWARRLLNLDPENRQAIATVIAQFEGLNQGEAATPGDVPATPGRISRGKVAGR